MWSKDKSWILQLSARSFWKILDCLISERVPNFDNAVNLVLILIKLTTDSSNSISAMTWPSYTITLPFTLFLFMLSKSCYLTVNLNDVKIINLLTLVKAVSWSAFVCLGLTKRVTRSFSSERDGVTLPLSIFQIFAVPSSDPVNSWSPFGENSQKWTAFL